MVPTNDKYVRQTNTLYYKQNAVLNKQIFNCVLKCWTLSACFRYSGIEFHKRGAMELKALSPPDTSFVFGTTRRCLSFDLKTLLLGKDTKSSDRYSGASP